MTVANLGELLDWKKGQKLAANKKKSGECLTVEERIATTIELKKLIHTPPQKEVLEAMKG